MTKKSFRILAAFSFIIFLQTGRATVLVGPQTGTKTDAAPVVKQLVKTTQSWNGATLPRYQTGQPEITIMRLTIPAGAKLDPHLHPVINAGLIISGELTVVTQAGKKMHFKAGDGVVEVVNTLHYGINEGKVPTEIVVFYAGAVDVPITVAPPR
jgi:quercetin dioxygenase-like cupin family protein